MAKNEENYNNSVLGYLDSIENDKLDRIASAVSEFTKKYNNYVKLQEQKKSNEKDETVKEIKSAEKNRKADAVKSEAYLKKMAENSNVQSKTLTKILEESLDSKSAQETLKKIQESSAAAMKTTNQEIIKGLSELASSSAESLKNSEKLNSMTAEMQKENTQARLQDMLKDTKRFRLESKYWKDLTGGIKGMAAEFHDFKNNPSRWMSEAMGDLLGHALDKSIDGLKETFSAGLKSITQGLNGLKSSIFDMLADQKKQAEGLAQEFNRSYLEASGALSKSNMAVSSLAQRGELDISRTSKNIEVITSKMLRRFGDDLKNMSQDEYERNFKSYAQLINAGAADKIDEIEEIAGGNVELMDKMIKAETQLAGIRSRNDLRIQKGMESAIITAEEAHKLGLTYEQSIIANEKNQLFVAKVLASNKEMGVEETKAFTALQKTLMSQDFVTNILDDKNVNLSQLIGIDSNTAKRILTSGSDKERLDFMNRIIKNGVYNDIPALKKMMEDLGFDPMTLNVLSKQGGLKIDDASIKKITDAQNIDFQNLNDVLLSSGSKINEEIRTRISLLSSEGMFDDNNELTEMGKIQQESLKQFNAMEDIIRDKKWTKDNKEQIENTRKIYELVNSANGNIESLVESGYLSSEEDKEMAESIKGYIEKSDQLTKDQVQISRTLSEAQDLGLDKAFNGGGLAGLFSGLLDVGFKSAYLPEYQRKIESFMGNIKKSIEPAVNVFKELLIDPIIDSLKNNIGMLLGEILVSVKSIWKNMTKSDYSEEEKIMDKYKFIFSGSNDVEADLEKINNNKGDFSEAYKNAVKNINSMSISDIENIKGLSEKEKIKLQAYKAENSEVMNTGDKIMGTDEITKLDYTNKATSKNIQKLLQKSSITVFKNGKGEYKSTLGGDSINDLVTIINESDDPTGKTGAKFLGMDPDVNESDIFKLAKALLNKGFGGKVSDFYKLFGVDKSTVWNPMDMLVLGSYFLLKENLDIGAKKYANNHNLYNYQLLDHNDESDYHIVINGKPVEYANGGVVAATKGGQRITVGEAGYDEIIIPTDPAKQQRAQELLALAQDKYGLYANSPDNIDEKLKEQMADLLLDLRILMIQLDPMRDVIAMQKVMQAFSMLKNIGNMNYLSGDVLNDSQSEKDAFFAQYDLSTSAVPRGDMPKQTEKEKLEYENALKELASWSGGKTEPEKFISMLGPIAREDMRCTKVPASVTIAQAIQETGWGKSAKPSYRNLFGIKAKKGDPTAHYVWTKENRGGTLQKEMAYFRSYNSYLESILDHSQFLLRNKRYENAFNFTFEPEKFAVAIHKAGYATSDHYSKDLIGHIRRRNLQERFDLKQGVAQGVDSSTNYDPALQSTPNASYVSDQVCRADQAKIEKERRTAEKQNKSAMEQVTEVINNLGIKLTGMDMKRQKSVSVPNDKIFCTSGMSSSSVSTYCQG